MPAALSSSARSDANPGEPITATRARRSSSNRVVTQAPRAMTSQAPATGAWRSASASSWPTARASAAAASAPSTGAHSPSPSRAAGINPSGSVERSTSCNAPSIVAATRTEEPSLTDVRVGDQPRRQGRVDLEGDQVDQSLGLERAERDGDDNPCVVG